MFSSFFQNFHFTDSLLSLNLALFDLLTSEFLDFWVIKNGMHEIDWARVDWDRSTDEIQYRPVPNVAPFTFLIRGDSQIHIKNTVLRTLYYDNNEPMTSSLCFHPVLWADTLLIGYIMDT